MKHNPNDCERRKSGLTSELQQDSEIGRWCALEVIRQASRTTESSARTEEAEPILTPTIGGRFIAARDVLAAANEVDELIRELRHIVTSTYRDSAHPNKERLLELWMIAERCLLEGELNELRPAVMKRLFGEDTARIDLSREGQRQLGGTRHVSNSNTVGTQEF